MRPPPRIPIRCRQKLLRPMNYSSKVGEYNKQVHGIEKKDYSELVERLVSISKIRTWIYPKVRSMDHHEAVRKFEHLMLKEADHAREIATELEALAPMLTTENSRQLAQLQIKASHKQAKEFRELSEKVKEK
jgi:hypothetical protein